MKRYVQGLTSSSSNKLTEGIGARKRKHKT